MLDEAALVQLLDPASEVLQVPELLLFRSRQLRLDRQCDGRHGWILTSTAPGCQGSRGGSWRAG